MTKTIAFQTTKGAKIEVSMVTGRENLVDHTFVSPAWDLVVRINGGMELGFGSREKHPVAGEAIRCGDKVIPIPEEKLNAINELVAEYIAAIRASIAEDETFSRSRAPMYARMYSANSDH